MRTNRGITDDALGGAILGRPDQRRRIQMHQHDFVEARLLANGIAGWIHRPCQDRWSTDGNILGFKSVRFVGIDGDKDIAFLWPLARRLCPSRDGFGRQIQPKNRHRGQKRAPGRPFGSRATATVTAPLARLAHHLAPAPPLDCGSTPLEGSGSPAVSHRRWSVRRLRRRQSSPPIVKLQADSEPCLPRRPLSRRGPAS